MLHLTEAQRAYYYRLALAVIAVLIGYGVLVDGDAANISLLVGAILGLPTAGLAAANTATHKD